MDEAEGDEDELPVPAVPLGHAVAQQDEDDHLAGHPHRLGEAPLGRRPEQTENY